MTHKLRINLGVGIQCAMPMLACMGPLDINCQPVSQLSMTADPRCTWNSKGIVYLSIRASNTCDKQLQRVSFNFIFHLHNSHLASWASSRNNVMHDQSTVGFWTDIRAEGRMHTTKCSLQRHGRCDLKVVGRSAFIKICLVLVQVFARVLDRFGFVTVLGSTLLLAIACRSFEQSNGHSTHLNGCSQPKLKSGPIIKAPGPRLHGQGLHCTGFECGRSKCVIEVHFVACLKITGLISPAENHLKHQLESMSGENSDVAMA